jgi:hypothetical protein
MCILSSPLSDVVAATLEPTPARLLNPTTRQQLSLDALAGQPITTLANQQQVSRKFVYQQLHHAQDALDQAFNPTDNDPTQLLFWLPVTKPWLRQLVLGLTLICHSSLRGVCELLRDLFDYPLSPASVHSVLHQAVATARRLNSEQDLTAVRIGAHDEIFQAGRPVLVGADVASTSCYLLSAEEHRDADTWGVRLLELTERGFHPDATIADFAGGLRAGQAQALPDTPCRGDVFHALQMATPVIRYLDNRGYDAIAARSRRQQRQAQSEHRQGRKDLSLAAQLRQARVAETQAMTLADLGIAWLWRIHGPIDHKKAAHRSHSTPAGPALTIGEQPSRACCPAQAWMWPQTTSNDSNRRTASRTAVLPRLRPRESTSTAPWGGEWLTSTQPFGQSASNAVAWSSVKS